MRSRCLVAAVLFAALGPAGCGKSAKKSGDTSDTPEPLVAAGPPPQPPPAPQPETPPDPAPKPETPTTRPIPPLVVYNQPLVNGTEPAPQPSAGDPTAVQPLTIPPPTTLPPPPKPKEPPQPTTKKTGSVEEVVWPTEIYGRGLAAWIKDIDDDDPAVRELGLRTVPAFGPVVRKEAGLSKKIIVHMDVAKEKDPGMRAAAYEAAALVGFESDQDTKEAVRILFDAADRGTQGVRLHAVQRLAAFGPAAEGAITYLVGGPSQDNAYEIRRSVADTLGQIGFNEFAGPNHKAIACLVRLIDDRSAPVRLQAYQSIIVLGPPLLERPKGAPLLKDVKPPADAPKVDDAAVAGFVANIKKRLQPGPKPKSGEGPTTGLIEQDMQVEILALLALMRLDPKEINDENMTAILKYVTGTETGPKLQALNAFAMLGPAGARRLDDVVKALSDENPDVVGSAVNTLVAMGEAGKPAVPAIEKLRERGTTEEDKKAWAALVDEAVKALNEAGKPAVAPAPANAP